MRIFAYLATACIGQLSHIECENELCPPGSRYKSHCHKLLDLSMNYNFEQVNITQTRQGMILDLLFTTHPGLVQRHTVCALIGLSNHDKLSVTTSIKHIVNTKPPRKVCNFKKSDWQNIREDGRHRHMKNKHSLNSVDSDWNSRKRYAYIRKPKNHVLYDFSLTVKAAPYEYVIRTGLP